MSMAMISGVPKGVRKKSFLRKKREERDRASKVIENHKMALVIYGKKTNELAKKMLVDLHNMRKPHSISMNKKNDIKPFDDLSTLSFLAKKNDASLFCVGNSTKKKPQTLVMGRCFNYQVMDMMEFNVTHYEPVTLDAKAVQREGAQPCIIFQGDLWENDDVFAQAANLLTDYFKAQRMTKISVTGIDHAIVFTAIDEKNIQFDHFAIQYSRSNDAKKGKIVQFPRIDLLPIGPTMRMTITRTQFASNDLRNEALLIPYQLRHSKGYNKNLAHDELGELYGRVHLKQQDIRDMAPRKFKSMKKIHQKKANALQNSAENATNMKDSLSSYLKQK